MNATGPCRRCGNDDWGPRRRPYRRADGTTVVYQGRYCLHCSRTRQRRRRARTTPDLRPWLRTAPSSQPDRPPQPLWCDTRRHQAMTVTAGRTVTCQACGTQLRFYAWADTTRTTITCRRCHDLSCDQ
jgi:hypothetical protein